MRVVGRPRKLDRPDARLRPPSVPWTAALIRIAAAPPPVRTTGAGAAAVVHKRGPPARALGCTWCR